MYPANKIWQDNYILSDTDFKSMSKKVSLKNGTSSSRSSYLNTIFWRDCIEISHLGENVI